MYVVRQKRREYGHRQGQPNHVGLVSTQLDAPEDRVRHYVPKIDEARGEPCTSETPSSGRTKGETHAAGRTWYGTAEYEYVYSVKGFCEVAWRLTAFAIWVDEGAAVMVEPDDAATTDVPASAHATVASVTVVRILVVRARWRACESEEASLRVREVRGAVHSSGRRRRAGGLAREVANERTRREHRYASR